MAGSRNRVMRGMLDTAASIFGAVKQTWHARRIIINPIGTFRFFLIPATRKWEQENLFRFRGMRLYARRSDWHGVDEVLLHNEYREGLSILKGMTGPVVADLGANIGAFSMRVFSIYCNAVVHAVEPSLATFQLLEKNRQANPALNWHTYCCALWNQDGAISFEENAQASTGSHLGDSAQSIQVPSIRLKTLTERFIGQPIDLIKMDIEGAEEAVLFDSLDVLANTRTLILEIHPSRCDETKIRGLLQDLYPHVYEIPGRRSSKPLLLASRTGMELDRAGRLVV